MGIITLLRNALGFFRGDPHESPVAPRPPRRPKIEIYGPAGIRQMIRTVLTLTHTRTGEQYCVHELLFPGESASAPANDPEHFHLSEEAGMDIQCEEDRFWRRIVEINLHGGRHRLVVDAGPIEHRGNAPDYMR